jgi:hypothetical protein
MDLLVAGGLSFGGLCFECDACSSLLGLNQVLGLLAGVLMCRLSEVLGLLARELLCGLNEVLGLLARELLCGLNEVLGLLAEVLLFGLNEVLGLFAEVLLLWLNEVLGLLAKVLLFRLLEAVLFVDMDLLTNLLLCGTADTFFFVDTNLLLVANIVTIGRGGLGGSSKGFEILFFVTFPSDLFRLRR